MFGKTPKKQILLAVLLIVVMAVPFYRAANFNNEKEWVHKLERYQEVNRILIQSPKESPIEIESQTMVEQMKKYFEIRQDISIHKELIESKIKGTPVNVDFYIGEELLFSQQLYSLKEAALNPEKAGESFSQYIGGNPYAVKCEGKNVTIVGADAQVDRYLLQFFK